MKLCIHIIHCRANTREEQSVSLTRQHAEQTKKANTSRKEGNDSKPNK